MKSLTIFTVFSKAPGVSQRSMRMVSAPNISGTSVRTAVPPMAQRRSEKFPTTGFAVMPENPSEPPHLSPTMSLSAETGTRTSLAAVSMRVRRSARPSAVSSGTS